MLPEVALYINCWLPLDCEDINMQMLARAAPSKDVCAANKHALRASMAVQ